MIIVQRGEIKSRLSLYKPLEKQDYQDMSKFDMSISGSDILCILTGGGGGNKEGCINLIGKMVVLRQDVNINLCNLALVLSRMNIKEIYIFSISYYDVFETFEIQRNDCIVRYIEIGCNQFKAFLNNPEFNFLDYNLNSLYIARDSDYIDIKTMITEVKNLKVNIGRGGSQKSHIVSPVDFRLSSYLMAMFNFNFKLINSLNIFNELPKDRYLPFGNKSIEKE